MRFGEKLSHQGFILVSIPLIFEILFVCILAVLLRQAEYEADREAHSKAVIATTNNLGHHFFNGISALVFYKVTHNQSFLDQFDELSRQVPLEVSSLKALLAYNPDQAKTAARIDLISRRGMDMMEETRDALRQGGRPDVLLIVHNLYDEVQSLSHQLKSALEKLVEEERASARISPMAKEHTRSLVQWALWVGVVFNILLAVSLVLYFNRRTARRFNVLVDNTARLAKNEPLHPSLQGNDEIAHVDTVFHAMAEELNEVDRLKREFVAMVSHDLRTPLTSIQANISLLATGNFGELTKDGLDVIERADRSSTRLINMVNDLLDSARIETGKFAVQFKAIDLHTVIARSVEAVTGMAQRLGVQTLSGEEHMQIEADEERLIQVVVNLVSNAIKFTPAGGAVTISTKESNGWAEVRVQDQGPGIPSSQKENIFRRFQQVDGALARQKGGLGLGLAICKAIIEEHHGSIGVESEEGAGSTFWFRIPKEQPEIR